MSLNVHTARMGIRDPDYLDITRAGADKRPEPHRGIGSFFAPSRYLLNHYLWLKGKSTGDGELSDLEWLDYRKRYIAEMRASYGSFRAHWVTLLSWNRVVLVCFCQDPTRCHRTVLAYDILPKLGATYRGEIPHQGETENQ